MKRNYFNIVILCAISILLFNCTGKESSCLIKGTVVNVDTKSILLIKPYQDLRFDSIIEIPVDSGKFEYEISIEKPEMYMLTLGEAKERGHYTFMPIFIEKGELILTIHKEDEFDKNTVSGGELNKEFDNYEKIIDSIFAHKRKTLSDSLTVLFEKDLYNSDTAIALLAIIDNTKNQDEKMLLFGKFEELRVSGLDKSPIAKEITDKLQLIVDESTARKHEYISKNHTVVSYYLLLQELLYTERPFDTSMIVSNFRILSKEIQGHPYEVIVKDLLYAKKSLIVGGKYIDFSAPDLDGNKITLSNKINGKVALIDMWATWCGPCIVTSKSMIPIYEEFKDKGFTVIGIAGEFKNTDRLEKFMSAVKFPWLNLVELDKQNSIWQKYDLGNGGGGVFLVDKQGIILAINPTAEEVKEILDKLLS